MIVQQAVGMLGNERSEFSNVFFLPDGCVWVPEPIPPAAGDLLVI